MITPTGSSNYSGSRIAEIENDLQAALADLSHRTAALRAQVSETDHDQFIAAAGDGELGEDLKKVAQAVSDGKATWSDIFDGKSRFSKALVEASATNLDDHFSEIVDGVQALARREGITDADGEEWPRPRGDSE
jgi:hypothetical protein